MLANGALREQHAENARNESRGLNVLPAIPLIFFSTTFAYKA